MKESDIYEKHMSVLHLAFFVISGKSFEFHDRAECDPARWTIQKNGGKEDV